MLLASMTISAQDQRSVEEAKGLVIRAINSATKRDIASGGSGIDIAVIDSKGFRMVPDEEVKKFIK